MWENPQLQLSLLNASIFQTSCRCGCSSKTQIHFLHFCRCFLVRCELRELFCSCNACQIFPLSIMTSVVWLFEFLKNCRFWFLKYFRIKEPSVPVLWKKIRIKESSVLGIAKPLKKRQRISIKTMICSNVLSFSHCHKAGPGYVKILIIDND